MDVFNSKKLIRSKSGLKIVSTNDDCKSPFTIQEPNWVSDNEVFNCTHCSARFNFTTRKHHCRRCGNIFCNCCCKSKIELHRMCFVDPVRICLKCEPLTKSENIFFEKHLKLLLNGAVFKYPLRGTGSEFQLLHCKLSSDHRFLLFEGVSIPPIDINIIKAIQVETDSSSGLKRLNIDYLVGDNEKSIYLDLGVGPLLEKTGLNWMAALELAFKMVNSKNDDAS